MMISARIKIFIFPGVLSAFIFLASCHVSDLNGQSTDYNESAEEKIENLFAGLNSPDTPGASVAVVQNGEIVYKNGFGSANLEYNIPNTPSTVFHIASVSKQFTVFAILLLEKEGKLTLDDDIRTHIPEVPDFGETITLRHLASHTSGLRDQWNLLAMAGWRLDDVITREHVLNLVQRQQELNFKPGEEYLYSNTGFTLLAEVVARVSGRSFAEFTKKNIFDPLGMENTLFYDDHEKIVKNRAYSYYSDNRVYKKRVLNYAIAGATSLFTTVEDLALWALNFSSPKTGSPDMIEKMNTEAVLNNGDTFGGALGQFINTHNGLRQIQHGGADAGYRSYFGRFPDQDFAVILFSNYAAFNPSAMAMRIAGFYLEDYFEEPELSEEGEPAEKVQIGPKQLQSFAGHYWSNASNQSREIYLKNDTLRFSRDGNAGIPMIPVAENEFQILNPIINLKLSFNSEAMPATMVLHLNDNDPIEFKAYTPADYTSEDLAGFTGTYFSEELKTYYTIELNDGKLTASHIRTGDVYLTPVKEDFFTGNRWYMQQIEFERKNGDITGLKASGGRVRNIRFEKRH